MARSKQNVITFKADPSLGEAIRHVPNRSEFIRNAILAALDGVCPLCLGTGILTPPQRAHWQEFTADHDVRECPDCHERRLTCERPRRRKKGK